MFVWFVSKVATEAIDNIRTVVSLNREPTFESLYQENLKVQFRYETWHLNHWSFMEYMKNYTFILITLINLWSTVSNTTFLSLFVQELQEKGPCAWSYLLHLPSHDILRLCSRFPFWSLADCCWKDGCSGCIPVSKQPLSCLLIKRWIARSFSVGTLIGYSR